MFLAHLLFNVKKEKEKSKKKKTTYQLSCSSYFQLFMSKNCAKERLYYCKAYFCKKWFYERIFFPYEFTMFSWNVMRKTCQDGSLWYVPSSIVETTPECFEDA